MSAEHIESHECDRHETVTFETIGFGFYLNVINIEKTL